MVFEIAFVRQAYTQVLGHELKKAVRTLRAFPPARLDERLLGCTRTGRELAIEMVERVRRIDDIAFGSGTPLPRPVVRQHGDLLLELETAYLGAHTALNRLPVSRWSDVIPAPNPIPGVRQARRGEMLWLALRDLIRHDRHFAQHLAGVCDGGGRPRRAVPAERALDEVAASA